MTTARRVIFLMALGVVLALPAAAYAADPTIPMEGDAFVPAEVTVTVGETVTWVNKDAAFHDAVAVDGSWKTAKLWTNQEASVTFDTVGAYPYRCTLHANMKGTVNVVAQAPDTDTLPVAAHAVGGEPGAFLIVSGLIGVAFGLRRFRGSVFARQ